MTTGERFLSGTFFDLSAPGRRDGVLHAVYGGVYGRKNPRVLAPHPATGNLLPVLSHLGPAAPSGIVHATELCYGVRWRPDLHRIQYSTSFQASTFPRRFIL